MSSINGGAGNRIALILAAQQKPVTSEEMKRWMQITKVDLFQRLETAKVAAENPAFATQIKPLLDEMSTLWDKWYRMAEKWRRLANIELEDEQMPPEMRDRLDDLEDVSEELHDSEKTADFHAQHVAAQRCWEDFFYFQNPSARQQYDFNKDRKTLDELDKWEDKLIKIYHEFKIGGISRKRPALFRPAPPLPPEPPQGINSMTPTTVFTCDGDGNLTEHEVPEWAVVAACELLQPERPPTREEHALVNLSIVPPVGCPERAERFLDPTFDGSEYFQNLHEWRIFQDHISLVRFGRAIQGEVEILEL
ncbi:hypothetical protein BDV95DRAFT_616874 [Massariosphaeria phaeospora]|uniref:Uncharacterized protein n=1 Tax=Massariosphaeria phaeospora TaxID=100035 RepID=A0A7C8IA70_9PLEO|nr:hypothetical protein BDV95DRAFT_616874 [Massariosphaeria phaeospora]